MAQCIKCKATIPNGTQYCENCYSLVKNKADESYLDGLLSSITPTDNAREIYLKNKTQSKDQLKPEVPRRDLQNTQLEDSLVKPIPKNYSIFSTSDNDSDLDFLNSLFTPEEEVKPQKKERFYEDEKTNESTEDNMDFEDMLNLQGDTLPKVEVTSLIEDYPEENSPKDGNFPENEDILENQNILETQINPEKGNTSEDESVHEEGNNLEEVSVHEKGNSPEDENVPEKGNSLEDENIHEKEYDSAVDELLSDILPLTEDSETDIKQASLNNEEEEPANMKSAYEYSDNDQDILDLINEINNSQEYPPEEQEDIEETKVTPEVSTAKNKSTMDIGDVFSDALGAISSLEDVEIDDDLLNMIPDIENRKTTSPEKKNVPNKKSKKENKQSKESSKRISLWRRIFGNIKEELSEDEIEAKKQQVIQEGEEKEQLKKSKEEELKAKKEQDKLDKVEKDRQAKELAAKKKADKVAKDKEKKEEKEKRSKEIQELIDEIDENEGKINKVGASIVFVFFAATAIVIVIGTNLYSYAVNIKSAMTSFDRQLYNEAYQNVYGIDIKDEDLEIYDKIMTVMYVEKQLNSYQNYMKMKKFPEALDSLLKGLDRYEKYYMLASLHGIEEDLNYVKSHIVEQLNQTFYISEEEAKDLLAYEDQIEYSSAVYKLASRHVEEETKAELETDSNP